MGYGLGFGFGACVQYSTGLASLVFWVGVFEFGDIFTFCRDPSMSDVIF
jgi:hypothetical protein